MPESEPPVIRQTQMLPDRQIRSFALLGEQPGKSWAETGNAKRKRAGRASLKTRRMKNLLPGRASHPSRRLP